MIFLQIPKSPYDTRTLLNYIDENKIPPPLLLLLVTQFVMIIVDRYLYLRKKITFKLVFHIFIVFFIHAWLFFFLPSYTGNTTEHTMSPKLYYIIKSIYMLLSAYQIRNGYPARIAGNCLMKKYTLARRIMFQM